MMVVFSSANSINSIKLPNTIYSLQSYFQYNVNAFIYQQCGEHGRLFAGSDNGPVSLRIALLSVQLADILRHLSVRLEQ